MHLLRDYPFLIPLVVMVLCELTKVTVAHVRTGDWQRGLFRTGGMPSTHSAFVMSLLIIVDRKLGMQSIEFAIAFVFAAVVWYDALSVRRSVGQQAEVLNRLQHWQHFSEQIGHSLKEVLAGIAFGAVVTHIGILVS